MATPQEKDELLTKLREASGYADKANLLIESSLEADLSSRVTDASVLRDAANMYLELLRRTQ